MESPATAEEADDSCRANSVQEYCCEYFNHLGSPAPLPISPAKCLGLGRENGTCAHPGEGAGERLMTGR
jgi:hypothetical protein